MGKTTGVGKGNNPNSKAALKAGQGHLATNPAEFARKAAEVRRRRGIIRQATMEALQTGFVSIDSKDVELYDHAGNKIEVEYATARFKVPNYVAIGMKLMQEALKGNMEAMKLIHAMDENYKNREIALKKTEVKTNEKLADHLQTLKVHNKPIEIGEVMPYEETGRSVE